MGTKMAVSFANIFMVKIETTLIQQSETKPKNQRPITHLLSQNSPLSKAVSNLKQTMMEQWSLIQNLPLLKTIYLKRPIVSFIQKK